MEAIERFIQFIKETYLAEVDELHWARFAEPEIAKLRAALTEARPMIEQIWQLIENYAAYKAAEPCDERALVEAKAELDAALSDLKALAVVGAGLLSDRTASGPMNRAAAMLRELERNAIPGRCETCHSNEHCNIQEAGVIALGIDDPAAADFYCGAYEKESEANEKRD